MTRIGELARQTQTTTSALRYYEQAGLLEPAERGANGYRVYSAAAAGRIDFIRRAQALGLSIAEIRQLVATPTEDPSQLRHTVAHKLADLERRQHELATLHTELQQLYMRLARHPAPACGHVGDCGCWLPTEEEVMTMTQEVANAQLCDCAGCPDSVDCCGPSGC